MPTHAYLQQMRALGGVIKAFRRGHGGSGVAVFRATVPGFSECNATRSAPRFGTVAEAERYYASHPFYSQHEFVPIANRIAAAEMRRAGGLMLDVYPSSILRVDDRSGASTSRGGVDCLHYRAPLLNTSLATWALMLGQLLLLHEQGGASVVGPEAP